MGLFDKIFGANDRIKVQFIDNVTGNTIGTSEMKAEQLPQTFSVSTTMHIKDNDWTVEQAIPENAVDFVKTKNLILKMRKIEYINPKDILFTLPTISNELPETTERIFFTDFETSIIEDDWRQNEFLNKSSFPLVDIEISKIQDIWKNNKKEVEANFNAFDKCHVRETIGEPKLVLDLKKLQEILNTEKIGCLRISNEFVLNGFSLKTDLTTYYGTIENNKVSQFCIYSFTDNSIEEIKSIARAFDLIFVNWYHCDIITEND